MTITKYFRNLVIGKNRFLSSYGEYKQTMLSGNIALMGIVLSGLYSATDLAFGMSHTQPFYLITAIVLAFTIYLHRQGNHRKANCILVSTINLAVCFFASSESPAVGTWIFFISNSVAAFAIFGYKQRLTAIFFSALAYVLFVFAYFGNMTILPRMPLTNDYIVLQIVINFTFALPVTAMCVYLLVNLNHYNARQLVERNEQLNKTNTELDRFVYSTSHDLRAPLTSMMGLLNIIDRANEPDQKKYLGMMKDQLHSLDKFIKDITDYSRNNRLDIVQEKVRLRELAEEVWESLKFSPEAERIVFQIDIPDTIIIDSDKNRLKVIISNLVSNAIRYHDHRKETQYIRLAAERSHLVFSLVVEDNGQGIASEYHSKIFDMFYRANEQSRGSGLGLYIVREALMKLSGSIHLESSPGIGTTFTVTLPARPAVGGQTG